MKKILIIGGGVAGCSLAWQLTKKGARVQLLDKKENHSSFVAAGMINPIVFRRVNLSWRVDEMLPYARSFYAEIEETAQQSFCTPLLIRRFFAAEQERNYWNKKQDLPEFQNYLTHHSDFDFPVPNSNANWGSAMVKKGFRVDALKFMKAFHRHLITDKILEYTMFNPGEFNSEELTYQSKQYDSVVFCCGSENDTLSYFEKVNIEHTKGQIITIESDEINEKETWNQKGFILPIGNKKFKVGATIEREIRDVNTTPEALNELTGVIKNLTQGSFKLIKQVAGIRPTVYDRRPVMGEHPDKKGIYIFNGLGTKGYLLAPLLSFEMADHILYKAKLNKECCVSRFYKS